MPSVQTGGAAALVHIDVAEQAVPAVGTQTVEGADAIETRAAIFTRHRRTVIYVLVAVGSAEARVAGAAEVALGQTDAAAVRSAHAGRQVPHATPRHV